MPKSFKITSVYFLLLLFVYTILRACFYLFNLNFFPDVSGEEILLAFVVGMRFDVAALLMLNLPIVLSLNFPGYAARWKISRIILLISFIGLNLIGFILNIADFAYFPTVQRRLLFEPYTRTFDLVALLPGIVQRYLHLLVLLLLMTALLAILSKKIFHRLDSAFLRKTTWKSESVWFVIVVILVVIGIRGGLQLKPIRQTNAFFSSTKAVGYLTLNSTYTVLRSLFQPALPEYKFLPDAEASGIVAQIVRQDDETMVDPAYYFLRTKNPTLPPRKLNVVLFIMESWTAQNIGSITGGKTLTPFFDSLASRSILCTNFLANGQRSIEGIPSILTSVPGLYDKSIIGSMSEMNKYRGLGSILAEHGYTTSFHHGGTTGTMGFDAFVHVAGLMRYYGKEDFPNFSERVYDGAWGICDEPYFLEVASRLDTFPQPFCSVIFSLSSHDPYTIPEHRKKIFEIYQSETDVDRAVRYSDFSLGEFFRYAERQPWYENTIFLITADHTEFSTRNSVYNAFHIPLLIHAPIYLPPQRIERTGAHVDILPTLLDLLRIPTTYAAMGRSLMDSTAQKMAVVKFGPHFGIFTDSYLLLTTLEEDEELTEYKKSSPANGINRAKEYPAVVWDLRIKLNAYLQCATNAIGRDKIIK